MLRNKCEELINGKLFDLAKYLLRRSIAALFICTPLLAQSADTDSRDDSEVLAACIDAVFHGQ
jgi:hypothetical protein